MNQNLNAAALVKSRRTSNCQRILLGMAVVITSGFVGCGGGSEPPPKLASVKGKITINGLPAADLAVTFESQTKGGGRSGAVTNALGEYELSYAGTGPSQKGAAIGPHIVRIQSAAPTGASSGGPGAAGGSPSDLGPTDDNPKAASISIPEKYNSNSELKTEVVAGDNPAKNFDLVIPK